MRTFQFVKVLVGPQTTETRILPYDVVLIDTDTKGSDGAFQLVARMGESLSPTTSILSIIGGGPSLNWREEKELEGEIPRELNCSPPPMFHPQLWAHHPKPAYKSLGQQQCRDCLPMTPLPGLWHHTYWHWQRLRHKEGQG